MMYWESEVSGVCLLMVCVGVSLGIVHEDRIKWRNFFIRAIKLPPEEVYCRVSRFPRCQRLILIESVINNITIASVTVSFACLNR
mmetsp:Transcript_27944/g.23924  ORF Transcript_27944/g.23924 Transcript_27944/m.23924 type:complete len:85 (+) Transcript_27944:274-528(+)